jgi:N-carbamoyl-L-amino-acid hydrolase
MSNISFLEINGDRLQKSLAALAEVGKLPGGGVSRVAFTPADLEARELVRTWMVEAGMIVRWDAAGNMIGCYPGKNSGLGSIATGSHIDTVPVGGRYDGVLGVLAGIEVVQTLKERGLVLNHPIEVIVFTDEEVSVIGCKAMAGNVAPDPLVYQRTDGRTIQDCLELIHGNWSEIATAVRSPDSIAAFVELHVEQGGVLEKAQVQIGVVTGVVGQYRFDVEILGRANHAGTTPMGDRQDALLAAAQVVLAVNHIGADIPGDQVATVGYLVVTPNAANTVANRVDLKIDLRDLSQSHLEFLVAKLQAEIEAIAQRTGTQITMTQLLHILPTPAAPDIQATIVQVCQALGYSHTHLPSRAGHDAQEIGRFAPMGMIFVPSLAGISHSESEYTSPEQCTQGANVLLQTFLRLDQALD